MQVNINNSSYDYGYENSVDYFNRQNDVAPSIKEKDYEYKSAVLVDVSPSAQITLAQLSIIDITKTVVVAQSELNNIVNNKENTNTLNEFKNSNFLSYKDLSYEKNDFNDLSKTQAQKLQNNDEFFSPTSSANRILKPIISLNNPNVQSLEDAKREIVNSFNDSKSKFDGKLPLVTQATQSIILSLLNSQINSLKNN